MAIRLDNRFSGQITQNSDYIEGKIPNSDIEKKYRIVTRPLIFNLSRHQYTKSRNPGS